MYSHQIYTTLKIENNLLQTLQSFEKLVFGRFGVSE